MKFIYTLCIFYGKKYIRLCIIHSFVCEHDKNVTIYSHIYEYIYVGNMPQKSPITYLQRREKKS